jgi:glyoxylase-like metal-dependent hydrolase (beta-lactamase superfamily II)
VSPPGIWAEVGDRVFVRRYRTWNDEPFDQNVGAVLGADGVLVVDTRASQRLADELLGDLATLTRDPVAAVVNTHHHWDHTWGNARFAAERTWGHVRCAERVLTDSEGIRRLILDEEPGLAEELGEVVFSAPGVTFGDAATIDLGDRQVALRHLGRGHTDNDIVVAVPDAAVLFAGDLLENDAPPSFGDAFPVEWAATALRLAPLVAGVVVPGHGSVGDRASADRQAADFAALAGLGRSVVEGMLDEAEAVRRSPFPAEPTRTALERIRLELGPAGRPREASGG